MYYIVCTISTYYLLSVYSLIKRSVENIVHNNAWINCLALNK